VGHRARPDLTLPRSPAVLLEIFSIIVLVGVLIALIPTARRVFKKGDDE
jgi:hypothetical protein